MITQGKRVLIVDDEPEIRETIRESLETLDLVFTEANNGIEAMSEILIAQPDLIITDYNMPKMNGLQLVKEMDAADIRIPTIWLTGRGTDALYNEARRYGVVDYVDKPFNLESLQSRVRGSLRGPTGNTMELKLVNEIKNEARIIVPVEEANTSVENERRLIQEFLDASELVVPKSFLDGLKKEDIIEVYSYPDNRQLYSNSAFMRISSYTLEQMQTIPFQKLFWRSDEIQNKLLERAVRVVRNEQEAKPWGIEPHELVESLHPRRRTFEMHMGLISPVFDKKTGVCIAWATSLQVQLIYEWPEEV